MRKFPKQAVLAVLLATLLSVTANVADAQFDGHGPDAWQVTGVAADDVLNLRMGPGTGYAIIGSFPHDANGLTLTTCVPFMTEGQGIMLSQAERDRLDLPPRWCLMSDAAGRTHGWVAARFLMEDSGPAAVDRSSDAMIDDAVSLVERLYLRHEQAMRGEALNPLAGARARDFFMADIADDLAMREWQADPLYDAQETDISDFRVIPDPDQPMLRGMITVRAEFSNFGQPQSVVYNLRADTARPDAPVRIMRIDHGDWSYP